MLLSFITPTSYIEKYGSQSDFILALSHLIDKDNINEYEKAIIETKLPIYLDNGCFENKMPEGIDSLLIKAQRIKAKYVFAPDILYNTKKTRESYKNTLYVMCGQGIDIKLGVVVQANTKKEYIDFYEELEQDESIDLIGMSILAIPHCFKKLITESRRELMEALLETKIERKDAHLLGLGDSYSDVLFAQEHCPWIKSNDSSSCFWNAMFNKKIEDNGGVEDGKTKESVDFSFKTATQNQLKLAQYNINKIKKLCHK